MGHSADSLLAQQSQDQLADPPAKPDWRYRVVVAVTFAGSGLMLLALSSTLWFFYDDWAYLAGPGSNVSLGEWLLQPHSEHTIVWTRLWFTIVRNTVGLDQYAFFAIPMIAAHLLVAGAALGIVHALVKNKWVALAAALPVLLMGAGYENLLWAGQFSMILPVSVFMAWVWADCTDRLPSGRTGVALAATAGIVGTLSALSYVPLAAALALWSYRRGNRIVAATLILTPAAIWLFLRATSDSSLVLNLDPFESVSFVLRGLVQPFTDTLGWAPAGWAAVLVAASGAVIKLHQRDWRAPNLALWLGTLFFLGFVSIGRSATVIPSRYAYVVLALLIPAAIASVVFVTDSLMRSRSNPEHSHRTGLVLAFVSAVALAGGGVHQLWANYSTWRDEVRASEAVVHAAVGLSDNGLDAPASQMPEPHRAPDLRLGQLMEYAHSGKLNVHQTSPAAIEQAQLNLRTQFTRLAEDDVSLGECEPIPPNNYTKFTGDAITTEPLTLIMFRPVGASDADGLRAIPGRIRANQPQVLEVTTIEGPPPSFEITTRGPGRAQMCHLIDAP